jgi:hypothetical protein
MQYLIVKIEEQLDGFAVSIDNLSREDATTGEKKFADVMEQMYRVVADKKALKTEATPGTRY